MHKRLLLIAYYFPPLGMSGVQRVLKWAKYLPDSGWEVTVLTARPASYFAHDQSLLDDLQGRKVKIVRTRSIDPTRWVRSGHAGLPRENNRRRFSRISQAIFQPDNKIGWYPFALAAGKSVLRGQQYDAILSSAPPYTSHLVGRALSKQSGIPLFLEYRDDWIQNPRHEYATEWHRQFAVELEKKAFMQAAGLITINDQIAENLKERAGNVLSHDQICVIPHGYDSEDLKLEEEEGREDNVPDRVIEFLYNGVFYDVQKPDIFLKGLARFLEQRPDARSKVRARFVGLTPAYMNDLVAALDLEDHIILDGYLDHTRASARLMAADVLWMTVGRTPGTGTDAGATSTISTSKLFEYIGTRKPILGLVPGGAAREALQAYGSSAIVDPDDIEGTARAIASLYDAARSNSEQTPDEIFVASHDRRVLTRKLSEFLTGSNLRR